VAHQYLYTGIYQFVRLVKSTEWPIQKIYNLAKLHVTIIDNLKSIYRRNLQDIHYEVDTARNALLQGFYTLLTSVYKDSDTSMSHRMPLIHSLHNTRCNTVKVALVTTTNYSDSLGKFSNLKNLLTAKVPLEFHDQVFFPDEPPTVSGPWVDSFSSCTSSWYASQLLNSFNPQDNSMEPSPNPKRFRGARLSYAHVVQGSQLSSTELPHPLDLGVPDH